MGELFLFNYRHNSKVPSSTLILTDATGYCLIDSPTLEGFVMDLSHCSQVSAVHNIPRKPAISNRIDLALIFFLHLNEVKTIS